MRVQPNHHVRTQRQSKVDTTELAKNPTPRSAQEDPGKAVMQMNWSMTACILYSVAACVVLVSLSASGGIAPRWQACNFDEVWHAGAAILLTFSSMVTEACLMIALACKKDVMKTVSVNAPTVVFPGVGDLALTSIDYLVKLVCGFYIWMGSGGVMHTDPFAIGGPRPVYFARFAQWSLAVPVLVLITNKAFIDSSGQLLCRSWPSAVSCFFYVWIGWLMEVTTVHHLRWPLIVFAILGALVVSVDQIQIAKEYANTRLWSSKLGMLFHQVCSFIMYAIVFLMGRFGVIAFGTEQILYIYMDAAVKVFQGVALAMIRNRESMLEIRNWWLAASAASSELKDLLHQARVPTLAINLAGEVTDWNDNMRQLIGLTKEQVKGKLLVNLCSAACKQDLRNELQKGLDNFSKTQDDESPPKDSYPMLELSIPTHDDGSGDKTRPCIRLLAMMFVPKRDFAKNLEGAVAIGQDLSELTEMKLVQERKNALTAMISHEFRSPLHGMMGLVGVIMENEVSKPVHRQLGMVKGCAGRLLDMVTDVMTLAESDTRKMDGVTKPRPDTLVDFGLIIDEAIIMIGNSVDKANKPLLRRNVRLVNAAAGAKLPLIRGDPCKCTQVMYNLLTNACKFTDRGSITISFRHLTAEQRLVIDIADTGKGISEEARTRIFKPYEQESSKDVRSFQGIGLGLSVCKQIAENHRGSLTVQSTVGQGSTFSFSVPCPGNLGYGNDMLEASNMSTTSNTFFDSNMSVCSDGNTKDSRHVESAKMSAGSMQLKALELKLAKKISSREASGANTPAQSIIEGTKPLVLSVDDDEVNQEVIKNALGDFCEVIILMDGFETMKYLDQVQKSQARCPNLVLLDIQMPGMTGFEVCDAIRNTFAYLPGKLPVTMVSAKAPADMVAIQAFDSGSTDFVSKPFNRDVLKRKVVAALDIQAAVGSASSAYLLAQEAQKIVQKHEKAARMATEQITCLKDERAKHEQAAKLALEQVKALKAEREQMQSEAHDLQTEVQRLKSSATVNAENKAAAKMAGQHVEALREEQKRTQQTNLALMQEVERLKTANASKPVLPDRVHAHECQQKVIQEQSEAAEGKEETRKLMNQLDAHKERIKLLEQQLHSAAMQKKRKVVEDRAGATFECKTTQPDCKLNCHQGHTRQSCYAGKAVQLLASRLQQASCIARQCRELLTSLLLAATPDVATSEEERVHSHLEEFMICSKVVSSELVMLERVTSNIDAITSLAVQRT